MLDGLIGASRAAGEHIIFNSGLAREHGERHAVHVAGRARFRRVEIGVRVEPEDKQLAADAGAAAGDAVHRPHRQAVIAAKDDRKLILFQRIHSFGADRLRVGGDFREIARAEVWGPGALIAHAHRPHTDIAAIDDRVSEGGERLAQIDGAQRRGAP